jgi:hypothetical protein
LPDVPILVTENGIATGSDDDRIEYTHGALGGLHQAMTDGVDVRVYVHWSLLDNYEWVLTNRPLDSCQLTTTPSRREGSSPVVDGMAKLRCRADFRPWRGTDRVGVPRILVQDEMRSLGSQVFRRLPEGRQRGGVPRD